jgi:multisubunit Na+/H+ antiporter MnhC subunit
VDRANNPLHLVTRTALFIASMNIFKLTCFMDLQRRLAVVISATVPEGVGGPKKEIRDNLDLVELRNGDFVDPLVAVLILASFTSPDRPYWTGDGKPSHHDCRVETVDGSQIMVPCNNWAGVSTFGKTLAVPVSRGRRQRKPAAVGTELQDEQGGAIINAQGEQHHTPMPASFILASIVTWKLWQ